MKYVAYKRVSTKEQGVSGLGLEAQHSAIIQAVKNKEGTLISEYTDIESGKKNRRSRRKEFGKAIEECKKENACLVVKSLDRIS